MTFNLYDAANISFAIQQATYLESQLLRVRYPGITWDRDIPVDTSANPYAASVTFLAIDQVGTAKLVNGTSDDLPLASISLNKYENAVRMGGIGYALSLEELGQAQMVGVPIQTEAVFAANLAYNKFMLGAAFYGTGMPSGTTGLYNNGSATAGSATGLWSGLTADQIITDFNALLSGVWSASSGVELADTVRLPLAVYQILLKPRSTVSDTTVLKFLQDANIYTQMTGKPLDIKGDYQLSTRAVAYTKDPTAVKLVLPMPLQFLPPQPRDLSFYFPGMFRLAGLDIRRPGALRYLDGVA